MNIKTNIKYPSEFVTIGERNGESEYYWYVLAYPDDPARDILQQFFGDLDYKNTEGATYYTSDWCTAVWIERSEPISQDNIKLLKQLRIV